MGKLAISLVLLAVGARAAASDEAAIQSTFAKPFVEALRAKDKARLEQLLHPAVRACINPSTKDYFDYMLGNQADSGASGPEHITKLAPLKNGPSVLMPAGFHLPVQPTYEIQIQFESALVGEYLAQSNGSWFKVLECPDESGMAYFRNKLAADAVQQKKAALLVAELKDPLRGELRDLLRQHLKFDAIKKYQAATGAELTVAVMVMNALEKANP